MSPYTYSVCPFCETDLADLAEEWGEVEAGEAHGVVCCLAMREAMMWGEAGVSRVASDVLAPMAGAKFIGETGTVSLGDEVEVVSKTVANRYIEQWHRHLGASHTGIRGVLARNGPRVVGAATLATPTSRRLMLTGRYLEVNRIATVPEGWYAPHSSRTLRFNAVSKMTAELRDVARELRQDARERLGPGWRRTSQEILLQTQRPEPGMPRQQDLFAQRGQLVCQNAARQHPVGQHREMDSRAMRKYAQRANIERLRTYIFSWESGGSLRAGGWTRVGRTAAASWDRPSRRRRAPAVDAAKVKYDTPI